MTNENMIKQLERLIPSLKYADDVNAVKGAIKALSQEPTDDATLKDIFCMGCEYKEQEPCTDAVSRDDVMQILYDYDCTNENALMFKAIKALPSVTPQEPKSGHWVHFAQSDDCSECGYSTGKYGSPSKFCPNCGAKMVEPQERSGKE